jgi:hypothetical protein
MPEKVSQYCSSYLRSDFVTQENTYRTSTFLYAFSELN